MERPQRIISVAGAHSKVGKTTLCSLLLKELKDYGAIKFTKDIFGSPLIDSDEIILQKGKDTAIMAESGAKKVVLISGHGERLRDALYKALEMLSPLRGVIIEGNYPIEFLTPDLLIFVIGADREIKSSAIKIAGIADIVVVNSEDRNRDISSLSNMLHKGARVFFMDLKKGEGEIRGFLNKVNRRIGEKEVTHV
ncbi:MAG: hypothetical protein Fur0020_08700 [Thermodesulfovibrionia bacterium]